LLELLLQRSTVIALAVIGGILSIIVSWCSAKGLMSEKSLKLLNKTAYTFMAISMLLFVAAGLLQSRV
jgi:uncharacterized protein with PQ loop repeat